MSSGCELWIGCARWLRDLNLLTDKNGTMTEFAAVLRWDFSYMFSAKLYVSRDGVLLCRLANTLIPNSVDQNKIIKSQQQSQVIGNLNNRNQLTTVHFSSLASTTSTTSWMCAEISSTCQKTICSQPATCSTWLAFRRFWRRCQFCPTRHSPLQRVSSEFSI